MNRFLELKSAGAGKHLAAVGRELKAVDDKPGMVTGYGSVFGVKDSYGDIVAPGAFAASLADWNAKGRMPAMLWQHDPSEPVGVWTEMVEDSIGLRCTGQLLLSVPKGQEAYEHLKAGTVGGLSIGFQTVERTWNYEEETRTLNKVNLWEVSLVTFPANDAARVSGVKAVDDDLKTAIEWLGKAIVLHGGHMDGSEPTTETSQKKMMDMMRKAYAALTKSKIDGMGSMKGLASFLTIREFEDALKEELGFTNREARLIAEKGYRALNNEGDDLSSVLKSLRGISASFDR